MGINMDKMRARMERYKETEITKEQLLETAEEANYSSISTVR